MALTSRAPTVVEDFRLAANLIERALARLNTRETTCEHCGSTRSLNFRDANVVDQLGPAVAKLRRWADAMESPEDYTVRGELLTRKAARDNDAARPTRRGATHG